MTKVFIKVTSTYTPKNFAHKCILEELSKLDCILCNHQKEAIKLIRDAYTNAVNNYVGKASIPDLKKFNSNKDTLTYHVDEVIYLSIYSARADYTMVFHNVPRDWIKLTEENKPDGQVLGFNQKWIHEDFNPEGVRLCHWCGLMGWISSYWNNYHDCYDTRNSTEDNEIYILPKGEDQIPTHFCKIACGG